MTDLVDKIDRRHQSRIDRLGFDHLSRSERDRYSDGIERLKSGEGQSNSELTLDNRVCDGVMSIPSAFLCNNLEFILQYHSITTLDLDCNNISDVSTISKLSKIECLSLTYNTIETIEPFRNNKTLVYLDLAFNRIHDVSPLESVKTLMFVGLSHNPAETITSLYGSVNMMRASLRYTRIPLMQRKAFYFTMLCNYFNYELRHLSLRRLSLHHLRTSNLSK